MIWPNERSLPGETDGSADGSPWIGGWLDRIAPGSRVLDFACGSGRHARAAARRGLKVLAIDRDAAAAAALAASAPALSLTVRVADLEQGPWPFASGERFAAVIVTRYLFRPRFALLASLVAPDGLLLYETFARGNEVYGRPKNPAWLLEPGELIVRARQAGLGILEYATGIVPGPPPARIQRISAIRALVPGAPVELG